MSSQREEPPATVERLYEPIGGCFVDPCPTAIRMAMLELGPSFTYTLYVHPRELLSYQHHIREWVGNVELAYGLNICEHPKLDFFEWYVEANGRRVGSKGV
jgi:hypothetical protein